MPKNIRAIAAALILNLGLLAAWSDISLPPLAKGTGDNLSTRADQAKDIAMRSEEVYLTIGRDYFQVRAVFHMKNTGPETKLREGFPVGVYPETMKDFTVTSQGRKIEAKTEQAGEYINNKNVKFPEYWMVWDNTYPANAEIQTEVSYRLEKGWGYTLSTGAVWKGPIGKAVIELTMADGLSFDNLTELSRFDAAVKTKDKIVWTFENLEPAWCDNISIGFNPEQTWAEYIKKMEKWSESWGENVRLLNILELHDRAGYWKQVPAVLSLGEKKDGQLILPDENSVDDFIPTTLAIFYQALVHAQDEPGALAGLAQATDRLDLLLNKKVLVNYAPDSDNMLRRLFPKNGPETLELKPPELCQRLAQDLAKARKILAEKNPAPKPADKK